MIFLRDVLFFIGLIVNSFAVDFCYDEDDCNSYAWGDTFPSCHPIIDGHHSPINLDHHMEKNYTLEELRLTGFDSVQTGTWTLKNNGHSVVLDVGQGMAVSGGGLPGSFRTLQLHFHWGGPSTNGSEHTLNNRRYPMEMHIVNMKSIHHNLTAALKDPSGLAVLGVFIDVADLDDHHFETISSLVPSVAHKGKTVTVKPFPLINLLPAKNMSQFYRYHGSLTTPPCSHAVVWTVYEVPIYVSPNQVDVFASGVYCSEEGADRQRLLFNNYRHIHQTFDRPVCASRDATLIYSSASRLRGLTAGILAPLLALAGLRAS